MTWPTEGNVVQNISTTGVFGGLIGPSGTKLPVAFALSQSAIPVGIPSSGSIGNNGSLSGITSLQNTYAGIYLYFPANAIVVGQAAGLYWTVMSGVSAGTIFNNLYTGGEPTAPTSPTPFVTTGPGAYTQTTGVDITLRSNTLAANTLGVNGLLRVTASGAVNNTAGAKFVKFMLGGTNFGVGGSGVNFASSGGGVFQRQVANRGAGSQYSCFSTTLSSLNSGTSQYFTVDTTAATAVTITASLATATDYFILEQVLEEVFPS